MERDVDHSRKHERILEIYNRLLSGEVLSPAELAEEFGVTSKSIQRDINALNDFCANRLVESGEQSSINKYFPDELWNMHQRGGGECSENRTG